MHHYLKMKVTNPRFDAYRTRIVESFPERFWKSVKRARKSECWNWVGYFNDKGYGMTSIVGVMILAHRAAWEIENGPVPAGLNVLHKCDNPACCNPSHLYPGTPKENTMDCINRGRYVYMRGEKNGHSKLTESAVKEIRETYPMIKSQRKLARKFGVDKRTITFVLRGDTWKHV